MFPNATASCNNTITFATNAAGGAVLSVKDKDTNTSLVGPSGSDPIPASATISAGTAGWNISGGDLVSPIAVASTDQTVKTLSAKGETTAAMVYGYATAADQQAGQYRDVITYTVTAQ